MRINDTGIGGPRRDFPSTVWTDILAAGDVTSPTHKERLEQLLKTYWKPVFAYIRASWKKPVEDAKDLTQAFFAQLLAKETLSRMQPEMGSFRGYLKVALKHFLIDAERSAAARRPDAPLLSLEASPAELERLGPAAPDEDPEHAYDRVWFGRVIEAAIDALRITLAAQGKQKYFEVFDLSFRAGGEPPTYEQIAEKLGLKVSDVRNYLSACRKQLRDLLRARVRDYVQRDEDVDAELERVLEG